MLNFILIGHGIAEILGQNISTRWPGALEHSMAYDIYIAIADHKPFEAFEPFIKTSHCIPIVIKIMEN
jgi:hypothetical protein